MTRTRSVLRSCAAIAAAAAVSAAVSAAGGTIAHASVPAGHVGSSLAGTRNVTALQTSKRGGVLLPSTWPKAVPVPSGTIQAATAGTRVWLVNITSRGSIPQVRAQVLRLYTTRGFVNKPQQTNLILLQNAHFKISVLLYAHDHSPSSTDMRLEVARR